MSIIYYKEYQQLANLELEKLDAFLERVFETRDLIDNEIVNDYKHSYEVVIAFPYSMGERGNNFSLYYDEVPVLEILILDFRLELKNYIKPKNSINDIARNPTSYEEQYIKIVKKVLKKSKCQK